MTLDTKVMTSPRGAELTAYYRTDTSDLSILASSLGIWGKQGDEYGLKDLHLSGTAIDIGAHIGSVTLALLADNPDLRVVAVEPLHENAEVLRTSLSANGWTHRCEVIEAAIGTGRKAIDIAYDFAGTDYIHTNRFIGNMELGASGEHKTATVRSLPLSALVTSDTSFVKLDCESCEWIAFKAKSTTAKIPLLVAEGHGDKWRERAERLLGDSHDIEILSDMGGTGVFRAVRR